MILLNSGQLRCLNTLVSKLKIDKEEKEMMVQAFSGGRASSSKDLQVSEAMEMIKHLKSLDGDEQVSEKMRRKIISMAHEMGWEAASPQPSPRGEGAGKRKADMKRIDEWCTKFGYLHKHLNSYTYKELPKLVSQFEMAYKHYLSNL